MSLLRKMFGDKTASAARDQDASRFADSDDAADSAPNTRSAPRRDVLVVVLRETMRRHGVPSDWIEPKVLTAVSTARQAGVHLTLVVRGGQEQLLPFVPAFQTSFRQSLDQFDPRAKDWLLSLTWQFDGAADGQALSEGRWATSGPAAAEAPAGAGPDSQPAEQDDVADDLKALFAIRDAALRDEIRSTDFQPTQPGGEPTR